MKTADLSVSRLIAARPQAVYDVWIDPKSPGGPWYGAEGAIVQPHVDGLFYFAVGHEGKTWPHYGRFLDMLPGELVRYTWMSEATHGLETIITVTFIAQGDGTMVTLLHKGVPDDERGHGHEAGWTWMLDVLAERFQAKTPA